MSVITNIISRFVHPIKCVRRYSKVEGDKKKIIAITGCDSGLGYSLSLKCHQMGFVVVSGCLDLESDGAKMLPTGNHIQQVDVRSTESVNRLLKKVTDMTETENCELHAVVNNAGIMAFGEFEWLTEKQIQQHIDVNMMGCFRVAKAFLPLLRKHKGRLINITSHCSIANLPSLSVYGATKAAIQSWSDGLRVEQAKYGVKVITFLPGSLAMQSNIMTKQEVYAKEMEDAFSDEQRAFYGDYFRLFNSYLISITKEKRMLKPIDDEVLYQKFSHALLHSNPKACYKREPLRYFVYYNLFRFAPFSIRDYFVNFFMKFPAYKKQ